MAAWGDALGLGNLLHAASIPGSRTSRFLGLTGAAGTGLEPGLLGQLRDPARWLEQELEYARRERALDLAWQQELRAYQPGTLHGDYNRFIAATTQGLVPDPIGLRDWRIRIPLWDAAAALARHPRFLASGFVAPAAKRCKRRLQAQRGARAVERLLREEIFPKALLLSMEDVSRPRRIRLNKTWLKDDLGRVGAFEPDCLPPKSAFYPWLRIEAHRIAETLLCDAANDSPESARRRPADDLARHLAAESTPARQRLCAALKARGSRDPERALRALLMRQDKIPYAIIGQELGLSTNAARQLVHRVRPRA